jgi:hypothetical protein
MPAAAARPTNGTGGFRRPQHSRAVGAAGRKRRRSRRGRTYSGGGFTEKLLDAIGCADRDNSAKLAAGFPTYVALMRVVRHHPGALHRLINAIRAHH